VEEELAMNASRASRRRTAFVLAAATVLFGAGCSQTPTRSVTTAPVAAPPPQLYAYPAAGQDPAQLDRDRYDCHVWAVKQSRFDPSLQGAPPAQRVQVVRAGPPPGAVVTAGALSGAVLGAAVAGPRNTGEGALVGAAAGAVVGATAESAAADEARRVEQAQVSRRAATGYDQQSDGYRRALTACLAARGYAVR
jgi:hypothetical protein